MSVFTEYVAHPVRLVRGVQRALQGRREDEREPVTVEPLAPLSLEDLGFGYVLRFDLPGIERSALTVETYADRIAIRGRRLATVSAPGAMRLVNEPFAGEFARDVRLPEEIDPDRVRAHYADGILEIHAPKRRS